MKIEQDTKLDFKDVLIRPKRSTLKSRSEIDVIREITFKHSNRTWRGVPIITSNMDTVSTFDMYYALSKNKIITCFHKHFNIEDYPDDLDPNYYMLSTGIHSADIMKLNALIDKLKPYFVCIDVANGYISSVIETVKTLRNKYPDLTIVCGNVVSREMVEELLINGGADVIKIGIGNGSVCTTRLQTGVGMPQLSAVMECADAAHGCGGHIISDGGIVHVGDFSKAFGAGADFVMSGSMFSGHDESGDEYIEENGNKYKIYYGMSSANAMNKYSGGVANYRSSEGKAVKIPYKGPVQDTVDNMLGGIRSTCTYIGACRIKDIAKCTTFMIVNNQVNTIHNGREI